MACALILVAAATLGLGGCDKASDKSPKTTNASPAIGPASWQEQAPAAGVVPYTARTVIIAPTLTNLAEFTAFTAEQIPRPLGLAELVAGVRTSAGLDLNAAAGRTSAGLADTEPAVAFYDRGMWAIAAQVADAEKARAWTARLDEAHAARAVDGLDGTGAFEVRELGPADAPQLYVASSDALIVLARRADGEPGPPSPSWFGTDKRFVAQADQRKLLRTLDPEAQAFVLVRPAAWFADVEATGQAGVLLNRMSGQMGPLAVEIHQRDEPRRVALRMHMPGDPRQPTIVDSLGEATGEIPRVGGLIEPGVLGVVRISGDARRLFDLFHSTLAPATRRELDATLDRLDAELQVDLREKVIGNLSGHAVIVVYGLRTDVLDAAPAQWFRQTMSLGATREAVLLPIAQREPMQRVLDAWTTLSKGKLTRQAVGSTIQYAWLDEGDLRWALILSDDHVVYVDSAAAFSHASDYERRGRPLDESLRAAGVGRLLETPDVSGLYLDAASLASLLASAGYDAAARWLEPYATVVLTTGMVDGVGVTDVDLELAPAGAPE